MRVVISSLLILVMLMQTFSKTIIFTAFKINQDYITQNLCVNRDHPEKHCCGKCHLHKQMQKDDEQQNSSRVPSSLKSLDEIVLMCENDLHDNLKSFFSAVFSFAPPAVFISSPKQDDIFHPPSILS